VKSFGTVPGRRSCDAQWLGRDFKKGRSVQSRDHDTLDGAFRLTRIAERWSAPTLLLGAALRAPGGSPPAIGPKVSTPS